MIKNIQQWISMGLLALGYLILFPASTLAADPKPLFVGDDVIQIRIKAPMSDLIRNSKRSTDPFDGTLTYNSETHSISLAARGKSRRTRGFCKFPPLRVRFAEKPIDGSLFKGQKGLKLVTHCSPSGRKSHYVLLEYSAYRLLNAMTDESLRVRLAHIDYIDEKDGKLVARQHGFFIEDADDAAKRNGMKEIDVAAVSSRQLKTEAAARTALFHYMIGNVDWSMTKGAEGQKCCHNTKLMAESKDTKSGLVPVPYDFDHAGLIDADYAETMDGKSVRKRHYRGYCSLNEAIKKQTSSYLAKKDRLMSVFANVPTLETEQQDKARAYLTDFFKTLEDPKAFDRQVIRSCR